MRICLDCYLTPDSDSPTLLRRHYQGLACRSFLPFLAGKMPPSTGGAFVSVLVVTDGFLDGFGLRVLSFDETLFGEVVPHVAWNQSHRYTGTVASTMTVAAIVSVP